MTTKVPVGTLRSGVNSRRPDTASVRTSLDGLRATSHAPLKSGEVLDRSEILRLIQQTRRDCGMSQKELAITAGVTESDLSDALAGTRRFSAEWLWLQSDAFLLQFVGNLIAARHLTPENVHAVRVARIKELIALLLDEAA